MAKAAAKAKEPESAPVELFGLAEVKKGAWAVVRVVVEGGSVSEKEVLFAPEPREDAFQNLKVAMVRWQYRVG